MAALMVASKAWKLIAQLALTRAVWTVENSVDQKVLQMAALMVEPMAWKLVAQLALTRAVRKVQH